MDKTHVLSVMVENHAGVLSRVAGMFTRRAYNIDSLSVGITSDPKISRMTIATKADDDTLEQIKSQLNKLEEVIEIDELTSENAVLREHVLVKIDSSQRASVMEVAGIFRANIIDISTGTLTAELTGSLSKVNAFIELMQPYGIISLVRTGITGLLRG